MIMLHLVLHSVQRVWQLCWLVINDRVHASYVCLMTVLSLIQDMDITAQYFCRLSLHLFKLTPTIHCTQKNILWFFLAQLQRGLLRLIPTMDMFMVCSWSRNMVLAYMYSNASVHDRTVASVWELVGTFPWKTAYSKIQFTLHSQLASIQQLDKYSSPWSNKSVNTNNMGDSVLLRYGTASQKAFQDQSTTENDCTMFPQNNGIRLPTDTTSQTTRTQLSGTLLQKPQKFMAW